MPQNCATLYHWAPGHASEGAVNCRHVLTVRFVYNDGIATPKLSILSHMCRNMQTLRPFRISSAPVLLFIPQVIIDSTTRQAPQSFEFNLKFKHSNHRNRNFSYWLLLNWRTVQSSNAIALKHLPFYCYWIEVYSKKHPSLTVAKCVSSGLYSSRVSLKIGHCEGFK